MPKNQNNNTIYISAFVWFLAINILSHIMPAINKLNRKQNCILVFELFTNIGLGLGKANNVRWCLITHAEYGFVYIVFCFRRRIMWKQLFPSKLRFGRCKQSHHLETSTAIMLLDLGSINYIIYWVVQIIMLYK